MTEKNESRVFSLMHSKKLFLFITMAMSVATDLFLLAYCLISGATTVFTLFNLIFDGIFLLLVLESNFRMTYSKKFPFLFISYVVIMSLITFAVLDGEITNEKLLYYVYFNLAKIISVIFSAIYAVKFGVIRKIFCIGVTIILCGLCGLYSASIIRTGYLGQGGVGYRSVYYFEKGNTCRADSLIGKKGDKVIIPEFFNGKRVTEINVDLFNDSGIHDVYIQGKGEIYYNGYMNKNGTDDDLKIHVDKTVIDSVKNNYYGNGFTHYLVPSGLKDDEVYITFDYDSKAWVDVKDYVTQGNVNANAELYIKTYIGKKGEKFSLKDHAKNVPYAKEDVNDENVLKSNFNKKLKALSPLMYENNKFLDGAVITESIDNAKVEFKKVKKVVFSKDNDTKFSLPSSFFPIESNTRYVLENDPNDLLKGIERKGFSVDVKYSTSQYLTAELHLSSLEYAFKMVESSDTIYLELLYWLNAPTISEFKTDKANNTITYGDNATLTVYSQNENNYPVKYEWKYNGSIIPNESGNAYNLQNVKPANCGQYEIFVTIGNNDETSLTSTSSKRLTVNFDKKPITLSWKLNGGTVSDFTYDGIGKTLSAEISGGVINGDMVTLANNISTVKTAGKHSLTARINNGSDLYKIASGQESKSVSINPMTVDAVWSNLQKVYDGFSQQPTVTATGVSGDGDISLILDGAGTNKGTYNVSVKSNNANYVISESTKTRTFEITPCQVSVNWGTTTFTYDGNSHIPTASITGKGNDGTITLSVSGEKINAGTGYTATATLQNNDNYTLIGNTTYFDINKRTLKVNWSGELVFTYNGTSQAPIVSSIETLSGETVTISFGYEYYTKDNMGISGKPTEIGEYIVKVICQDANNQFNETSSCIFSII